MSSPYETLTMDRAEWLEFRRSHIGGSDVAAIMGLSPWRTPYQVWAEKTGLAEPDDISGSPRVEWGTRLEKEIYHKFSDAHPGHSVGTPVRGTYETLVPVDRPWAMATLDGTVDDCAVLEIKTAHFPTSKSWGESGTGAKGVPAHYLAQVNHYLSVTGWDRAHVAVLIDGWDYREYVVERDAEDVAAVTEAVDRFWRENVEAGVPPEVTAVDSGALLSVHDEADGEFADGDYATFEMVEEWNEARARSRTADAEARAIEARLKEAIGDRAGLLFPEGRLTWSRRPTRRFDAKALKAAEPDVYERYCRDAVSQRLTWKES